MLIQNIKLINLSCFALAVHFREIGAWKNIIIKEGGFAIISKCTIDVHNLSCIFYGEDPNDPQYSPYLKLIEIGCLKMQNIKSFNI